MPIASPWAQRGQDIKRFVLSDALGAELTNLPLDRSTAMGIPAVSRGRDLIVGAIAPLPLTAMRDGKALAKQPVYLTRTDTLVSPAERVARTVDSLIFNGRALWAVRRGARQEGQKYGPILDAAWVPDDEWTIDSDGRIRVQGNVAQAEEVILFNGYKEGLLNTAQRTLRGAIATEDAWVSREVYGAPYANYTHVNAGGATGQTQSLEQDEIDELLTSYKRERAKKDGRAVGYTPPGLSLDLLAPEAGAVNTEGRNAIRVDIASHLGIPASLLDGSVAEAALTYVTTEGNAVRFWTETLPLYIAPIENALTLASPGQTEVRFARPELLTAPGEPIGAPEPATPSSTPTAEEAVTNE